MNINICERGCGATSLDPNADIQQCNIIMRAKDKEKDDSKVNMSVEVCGACRRILKSQIESMFTPVKVVLEVKKK